VRVSIGGRILPSHRRRAQVVRLPRVGYLGAGIGGCRATRPCIHGRAEFSTGERAGLELRRELPSWAALLGYRTGRWTLDELEKSSTENGRWRRASWCSSRNVRDGERKAIGSNQRDSCARFVPSRGRSTPMGPSTWRGRGGGEKASYCMGYPLLLVSTNSWPRALNDQAHAVQIHAVPAGGWMKAKVVGASGER
jgi:hypothetical protein